MTTTWESDTRRNSRDVFRKPARPPLEMPVLFQLADLSVQQIKAAPLPSVLALSVPAAPQPAVPAEAVVAPETPAVEPVHDEPLQPAILKFEVLDPEPVVAEEPPAKLPASDILLETTQTEIKTTSIDNVPAIEATATVTETATEAISSSPAPALGDSVTTEVVPPADAPVPTQRDRAEQRTKARKQAPPKSDWMRTHGKFIAVGFIIALIATIYMAQNGDEPAPANPDSVGASAADKLGVGERESSLADVPAAKESVPVEGHQPAETLAVETSPASVPAIEAHAELHPPPSGGIVKEPADIGEVADAKSLFPWKDATQTRVAAKPDDGRAKPATKPLEPEAPALSKPAATDASAEEAPSIYGPPGSANRGPGAEPASGDPQLNAPTTYPVTNPSSFRVLEPPQARPNVGQTGATPASYDQTPQPRTSGPRHERTGSGLY